MYIHCVLSYSDRTYPVRESDAIAHRFECVLERIIGSKAQQKQNIYHQWCGEAGEWRILAVNCWIICVSSILSWCPNWFRQLRIVSLSRWRCERAVSLAVDRCSTRSYGIWKNPKQRSIFENSTNVSSISQASLTPIVDLSSSELSPKENTWWGDYVTKETGIASITDDSTDSSSSSSSIKRRSHNQVKKWTKSAARIQSRDARVRLGTSKH